MKRVPLAPFLVSMLLAPGASAAAPRLSAPSATALIEQSAGAWAEVAAAPNPDGRMNPHMTYAPELGLLIMFGGFTERGLDNDVFWLDVKDPTAGWRTLPPGSPQIRPTPRTYAGAAWDPDGHRMIVFGGAPEPVTVRDTLLFGQSFLNDVWALVFDPAGQQPPRWEELSPTTDVPHVAPARRVGPSAIYDPTGKRLIVFGGNDTVDGYAGSLGDTTEDLTGLRPARQGKNDVWAFDLSDGGGWTALDRGGPDGDGPHLFLHQAVHDPLHGQMVVTGGADGASGIDLAHNGDTYSFDLMANRWSEPWPAAGRSPAMVSGASGYSAALGALVVGFGRLGPDSEIDSDAVYALKLVPPGTPSEWVELPSEGTPHRALYGVGGTVIGDGTLVCFGGSISWGSSGYFHDANLSAFDMEAGSWRTMSPASGTMSATAKATAVYENDREHMLVVGGRRRLGVVWDLDLTTGAWRRVTAAGSVPQVSESPAAVYDPGRHRVLVYSRGRVSSLDREGSAARWVRLGTLGDAPDIDGAEAVYDPIRDRVLLVGGSMHEPMGPGYFGPSQLADFNDQVFALHLSGAPAWQELRPAGDAPQRTGAAAVYDPARDRLLLFGGRTAAGDLTADVYELDLRAGAAGTWRRLATTGAPPIAREGAVAALDLGNDQLVVWGGDLEDPATYTLDLTTNAWSALPTQGDPVARKDATGIYDPVGRRLVVHGGFGLRGEELDAGSRDTLALALAGDGQTPVITPAPEPYAPPVPGPVRGGTWTPLGPGGARVAPVALSPAFGSDRSVFAGTVGGTRTDDDAAGIFASRDAGATWKPAKGAVQGAAILRIAPAPSDPTRIYAAARGGTSGVSAYASDDAGATWRDASEGLPPGAYLALAAHPSNPNIAWTAGDVGGLYVTHDGGATWDPSDAGLDGQWIYGLTAVPLSTGVRLLAAGRDLSSEMVGTGRVFVSDDLGATWDLAFTIDGFVTYTFAFDPSNPQRVLMAAADGIWASEDGGSTWEPRGQEAMHASWLAFDPTSDGRIVYAAGVSLPLNISGFAGGIAATPGLFRSADGGETWKIIGTAPEEDFGGVAVTPDGRGILAASLTTGIHASTDGGQSFAPSSDGFVQSLTASIAVDAGDPKRLIGATHYGGAWRSTNGGSSWTPVGFSGPSGIEPFWYADASPVRAGRVLAANYSTLYKSETGGLTWSKVTIGPSEEAPGAYYEQAGGFAFHPTDPATWWVTLMHGGVATTHDNGQTLSVVAVASFSACLIPIAVNPGVPSELLAGDTCGGGVWLSTDGGLTWSNTRAGLDDTNITALAYDPSHPGTVFAGTLHEGVYRSTDGGRSWSPARSGLGFKAVKALVVDAGGRVFAALTTDGIYESDDAGATWSPVLEGLLSLNVLHIADDRQGSILAATKTGGVVRLTPGNQEVFA